MTTPERRNENDDQGYFILGIVLTLIGVTFFTTRVVGAQERLFTAACLIVGVVILATAPRYMWRFRALCTSVIVFGGISVLYGVLVFVTGESGGPASHHVAHTSGIYPIAAGAIIAMIGFVLRTIYSAFHE